MISDDISCYGQQLVGLDDDMNNHCNNQKKKESLRRKSHHHHGNGNGPSRRISMDTHLVMRNSCHLQLYPMLIIIRPRDTTDTPTQQHLIIIRQIHIDEHPTTALQLKRHKKWLPRC